MAAEKGRAIAYGQHFSIGEPLIIFKLVIVAVAFTPFDIRMTGSRPFFHCVQVAPTPVIIITMEGKANGAAVSWIPEQLWIDRKSCQFGQHGKSVIVYIDGVLVIKRVQQGDSPTLIPGRIKAAYIRSCPAGLVGQEIPLGPG